MNPRATPHIEQAAADWILRREAGLGKGEPEAFAAWLAADPRHAEALTRVQATWALLDRPRANGSALALEGALRRRAARRGRRRLSALGAAAVLAVSGFLWTRDGPPTPTPSRGSAIVLSPTRQTLPDGTQIEARAGATFSVSYEGPERRVALRGGEALFHVARDPQRPFIVSAGGVEVRAVGTAFLVGLAETRVDVIVTEGQVAVNPAVRNAPLPPPAEDGRAVESRPETRVDAGNRLVVNLGPGDAPTAPQVVSADELEERLSWRATRLEFSHTPLAEAIALMNGHSAVRLAIDDPELAALPVNGIFRADNSETLLRLLEANFDVASTRVGDTITLRRRSR